MADKIIKRKLSPAKVTGRVDASSFNAETNEVNVVFATENMVLESFPNGERFYEQLEVNVKAGDLDRFNNGAAVLDNHNAESIRSQFGKVTRAWIDETKKEGCATLKLSDSEDWKTVVNDIAKGVISNISFTFRRNKMMDTGTEKDGIRILKTVSWEGLEISFVTIPADYKAGVRGNNDQDNDVTIINHNNKIDMTEEEKKARREAITDVCRKLKLTDEFANTIITDELITVDAARSLAIDESIKPAPAKVVDIAALEGKAKKRSLEIIAVCRKLNLSDQKNAEGIFFPDELIAKEITLDQARALMIDKAAEIQAAGLHINGIHGANVLDTKRDGKRALAMEHSILQRAGIVLMDADGKAVKYDADVYGGMSLKEIAFEGLKERGLDPRSMNINEQRQYLLNPEYAHRSAGQMTTSDFPSITENVLNKVALQRYQLAERTWEPLVKKRTVKDFKPVSNVRLNDVIIDEDSQIEESGEYTFVKMTDSKESYAVRKYGKKAILSWEALINDDLSLFNDTTSLIMDGFTQFQNKLFYQILASDVAIKSGANKMFDGKLVFDASHKNIAVAAAISIDSLSAMRLLLRTQKAPNGSLLNLNPKFLIVGPQNEQLAEQFTSSNYVATEQGKINKLGASLTPIVDAQITDGRWFLSATPSQIASTEVASLAGQEMYTESRYSFDVDGMEIKFRLTHGIKVVDFRGMVKNPGL
jgi:hypothetical protein